MTPIIEVSDEYMGFLNPDKYTRRKDLETKTKQIEELDRSKRILIKEVFREYEKYKSSVDSARLTYDSAIEKVAKDLDLSLKNTSKDSLEEEFIDNRNLAAASFVTS
ncbi:hypothetical protein KAT80_02930 [Candidatus Pacearchaeota archaeon]|nr:hypothetical protein [Candidatus Pacearchaeota archaeon]